MMQRAAAVAAFAIALQTGSAASADKATPPPMFWAGFYFGGNFGAGVPRSPSETLRAVSGFPNSAFDLNLPTGSGASAAFGPHVGYNWQRENLVYGVETEFGFLNTRQGPHGAFAAPPAYASLGVGSYTIESSPSGSYLGLLRARVGYSRNDTLYYLTAGVATGGWTGASNLLLQGGGFRRLFISPISSSTRTKFIAGGGVERSLGGNWSLRGEYLFLNQSFNTKVFGDGAGFAYQAQKYSASHLLRLGLSYHFANTEPPAGEEESPETKKGEDTGQAKSRSEDIEPENDSGKGRAQNKNASAGEDDKSRNKEEAGNGRKWAKADAKEQGKDAPKEAGKEKDKKEKDKEELEIYSVHGQSTLVPQGYPKFPALYSGPHSLKPPWGQARVAADATAYFGLRLWDGAEAYVNPEIDDGYGLSGTLGVAGFPNSEALKVGRPAPYLRFQRYFLRQTIGLGGESEKVESGANALAGAIDANRLVFTVGKFAVVDIFDDNRFAHDGRSGFFNWTINDMGAFDYAADAWGYTNGAALEWRQDWWTARAGVFQLSRIPNGEEIEPVLLRQFMQVAELEARHELLFDRVGKIKLLGYADHADIGKYQEALETAFVTGTTPDVTLNRKKRLKAGGGVNIEQPITDDLGFFLRASSANGRYESIEFTEVERSLAAGFVLSGSPWGRPKDAFGFGGVVNGISHPHANYLAAGGLGFLLGDGALNYGGEHIFETYYRFNLANGIHVTGDYQFIDNPGYNRDRSPVSLFAVRLHAEF